MYHYDMKQFFIYFNVIAVVFILSINLILQNYEVAIPWFLILLHDVTDLIDYTNKDQTPNIQK